MPRSAFATLLVASALAGCTQTPNPRYPSLLPRAIETRSDSEPEAPPPAAATPDPMLDQQIVGFRRTLAETQAAFGPAADRAGKAARAAGRATPGSEPWIAAQTALAELDSYRATTSATLTDIEQIAIARAADDLPDYPGLGAARDAAQMALDAQTARIAQIQALLPAS